MNRTQALAALADLLAPFDLDRFWADHAGRAMLAVKGAADHPRAALLGDDPRATILAAWATHAAQFGFHADGVTGPPPPRDAVDGAEAFAALIAEHHRRGYTLHIPDLAPLAPDVRTLLTAIEVATQQPAKASLFWSRPGNRAPVHYDARDNFAIQLVGTKRWYVSTAAPRLPNPWTDVRQGPEPLGPHTVVVTEPGDLLFIPRGVLHTVETVAESLHLSVTFLPVTLRDAMIAAVDRLAEEERGLRDAADADADAVTAALLRLGERCRSEAFVAGALARRATRRVGDLPKLPPSPPPAAWSAATRLAHAEGAQAAVATLPEIVDFAVNGQHIGIHLGAEAALRFVADTPAFRLGDIPGLSADVAAMLVQRLLQTGFLTLDA